MARTVSPTPSNDTLLLTSLLSTNAFSACPCTEPHMGEQQPEVSASRGTELSTKTTQFLSERQHLCLTSPDCAGTQMKRRTERLRGNCCYLHRRAQGFLNGRPKRQSKQDFFCTKVKSPVFQGQRIPLGRGGEALRHQGIPHLQKQELGPLCIHMAMLKTQQILSKCCHIDALSLKFHLTHILLYVWRYTFP